MLKPHGEKLVNKITEREELNLPVIELDEEQLKDVINIATGVYSPLGGFLKEEDFKSVVSSMRLQSGIIWPIPIVLDIKEKLEIKEIALSFQNKIIGKMENIEVYKYDKDFFTENVFGTKDNNHPGVSEVYDMEEYLVGGDVFLFSDYEKIYPEYNLKPEETREEFEKRGWNSIVAFQTRNVPHIGHEFLQKEALKEVDGLFIQPVIGRKKEKDFKDEYILVSYEVLIDRYYPKDKVMLGILPIKMRYAGPREAVFHALIRKNFGCTHFIVGRDHAGVGDYYKPFEAHEIFNQFEEDEIGIKILKFPEVVYCPECKKHLFTEKCEHEVIRFSGTRIRDFINKKEQPPTYFLRPEIFYFLANGENSLVDSFYKQNNNHKGFVLWFTGLSQSGKTTIADGVYEALKEKKMKLERLDGDIVREYLSHDLGFTHDDREENIKRIGLISKILADRGVGVIASFISPYIRQRDELRKKIGDNFIEIHCDSPLPICESRDTKGYYQKAREGIIKNFTGISDPYEEPENPELKLATDSKEKIEENVKIITRYLKRNEYIK